MGMPAMDVMMVGNRDELSFEDMRPEELAIVKALGAARQNGRDVLRIAEIMSANGWDEVEDHECAEGHCSMCSDALRTGNSKVRNNLRRLMRYGWVTRPLDGAYALLVVEKTAPQVEVVQPPLVPVQAITCRRNPKPITEDEQARIRRAWETREDLGPVKRMKKPDCSFYNACLDQAESGDWAGFSCVECTAYARSDQYQAEMDVLALRAAQTASDELERNGKINRVRGVKPGADAKRTIVDHEADSY